jgi:hypothetical protein
MIDATAAGPLAGPVVAFPPQPAEAPARFCLREGAGRVRAWAGRARVA